VSLVNGTCIRYMISCNKAGLVMLQYLIARARILALATGFLLVAQTPIRADVAPKRVLMLQSFGLHFKPWTDYAETFRAEMNKQSKAPIDFLDHLLLTARLNDDKSDTAFVDYLHSLYAGAPPDLIVALGAPAANFVQRYRTLVFPNAPMLFYAVEARRVQYDKLTEFDTVVAVAHDFPAAFETIMQVSPDTKLIAVVNGASPNEVFWQEVLERELAPLSKRVELRWYNRLSFEEILKDAAGLPDHSAIFWHLMSVDAAGVVHEANTALKRLSAAANAPIFSYLDVFFGENIVGGSMHSVHEGSGVAAAAAIRILNGEKAGDIKTSPTRFTAPRFDWRQLDRWHIREENLPLGSEVYFRQPTAWERYQWQISLVAAALLVQAVMIMWLIYEHRRRRGAEITARGAMAELMQMDRLASAGEFSASVAHEINQPLGAMALNANAAMNFLRAKTPDLEEVRVALERISADGHRAGQIVSNLRAMFKKDIPQSRPEPVDLNDVILSVLELASVELRKDQIVVRTQLGDGLPNIVGSQVQLQQLVLNMVMNARDAMRSVSRQRELIITSTLSGSGEIEISVEDTGPGISEADRDKIFQPMFSTKSNGMGMGLAICKSIVEAHQGRISVASGSKAGALFRFRLPSHVPSPSTVVA
jgi:signal transduction histidine kinase